MAASQPKWLKIVELSLRALDVLAAFFGSQKAKRRKERAEKTRKKDLEARKKFKKKEGEIEDKNLDERINKFWGDNGKGRP